MQPEASRPTVSLLPAKPGPPAATNPWLAPFSSGLKFLDVKVYVKTLTEGLGWE